MDSTELSNFYRSVTKWPTTDGELRDVAERTAKLLGAPFAAIALVGNQSRIGFHLVGQSGAPQPSPDSVRDHLRRALKQTEGAQPRIRQFGSSGLDGIQYLNLAHVWGELKNGVSGKDGRDGRTREEFAWLFVGTPKPLGSREEVLLMAAAQRLSELAEVAMLEQAIEMRSQFLSIASHELKTPLTSIYGILQLQERMLRLKKDDAQPQPQVQERQHQHLKMVIRQVERLNELIDGLLDVSRIQNGRFIVEPSDTDVAQLLKETTSARLQLIAQEASVSLSVDAPDTFVAWVDPVRMEEVITNLVMNAIRFSPEGGVIWVRLREDAGSLRLMVRDQGPSVPPEDRERIFRPFERAQRTSRLGGLGLGLFISRQIAQLHGGNVSLVESIPGRGNVFEATFPVRNLNLISASA